MQGKKLLIGGVGIPLVGALAIGAVMVFAAMVMIISIPSSVGGMVGGILDDDDGGDGSCAPVASGGGGGPDTATAIDEEQTANIRVIVGIGKTRKLPQEAWTLALMTAFQESGVRNLPGGDRDSEGMFQQRPSQGWGTSEQVRDPAYSTMAFFGGPDVPPGNGGLMDLPDWQGQLASAAGNDMASSHLAQKVQRSGFPDAYAKHYQKSASLIAAHKDAPEVPLPVDALPTIGDTQDAGHKSAPTCGDLMHIIKANGAAKAVIEAAVGVAQSNPPIPYAWGGGNKEGPTKGIRDGGVADSHGDYEKVGFDCSGLMEFAFYQGAAVEIGGTSRAQYAATAQHAVPADQDPRAGDLLFYGANAGSIHHVALAMGNGQMVEAPQSGLTVRVTPVRQPDFVNRIPFNETPA